VLGLIDLKINSINFLLLAGVEPMRDLTLSFHYNANKLFISKGTGVDIKDFQYKLNSRTRGLVRLKYLQK